MVFINPCKVLGLHPEPLALLPAALRCPDPLPVFWDPNLTTSPPRVALPFPDLMTYPLNGFDFLVSSLGHKIHLAASSPTAMPPSVMSALVQALRSSTGRKI